MKKSQIDAAIDVAVADHMKFVFGRVVSSTDDLPERREWAKQQIARAILGFDTLHEVLSDLAFDPEDPPEDQPETDEEYRARLLEIIVPGSMHRQAAETARGAELEAIGEKYDLKRGL